MVDHYLATSADKIKLHKKGEGVLRPVVNSFQQALIMKHHGQASAILFKSMSASNDPKWQVTSPLALADPPASNKSRSRSWNFLDLGHATKQPYSARKSTPQEAGTYFFIGDAIGATGSLSNIGQQFKALHPQTKWALGYAKTIGDEIIHKQ